MGTAVVCIILAVIVFFAVRSIIKKRKSGGCSCGCSDCSSCPACGTGKPKPSKGGNAS